MVLRSNFALLFTIQFALLFFFFFFFSPTTILSGSYLWNRYSLRLQIECAAWSGGLILHCCLPSNSLRYLFFFFATILSGVEFFILGDRSSVAYRVTENLSRSGMSLFFMGHCCNRLRWATLITVLLLILLYVFSFEMRVTRKLAMNDPGKCMCRAPLL